jgi:hypothetical protein
MRGMTQAEMEELWKQVVAGRYVIISGPLVITPIGGART